jgi:hypothetical protein
MEIMRREDSNGHLNHRIKDAALETAPLSLL